MMREVVKLILEISQRFRVPLCLHYFPSVYQKDKFDIYSVSINGKYLINFSSKNFADIPRNQRIKQILGIIKVGLTHNMGEKSLVDQVEIPRRQGKKLISRGKPIYNNYAKN